MKLKKITAFLLSTVIALGTSPALFVTYAENDLPVPEIATEAPTKESDTWLTSGDWAYLPTDNGTVRLMEYRGKSSDAVIPDTIDGKAVTVLGRTSFLEFKDITSLKIGSNIKEIEVGDTSNKGTLDFCSQIKKITVAEGNQYFCVVDGVLFNKAMTSLFKYPSAMEGETYTVPDGVKLIEVAAIYKTSLREIILPTSLEDVLRHSMAFNQRLESIDMSKTAVVEIGSFAFAGCAMLKDVKLPERLLFIGRAAFQGCAALEEIILPEVLENVELGAFAGTAMKSVTIPESVMAISYCAFGYNEDMTRPIPEFVIRGVPGSAAQRYCTDTDSEYGYTNAFTFEDISQDDDSPKNEQHVGYFKFIIENDAAIITWCHHTVDVPEIPEEFQGYPVIGIYKGAFYENILSKLYIPPSIKFIDTMAFSKCERLEEITFSEGLEEIGFDAFSGCLSLKTVNIPASVRIISDNAFAECPSMTSFTVSEDSATYYAEDGVLFNKVKNEVFSADAIVKYPCGKTDSSYKVPDKTTEIGNDAFASNHYLTSIDLNNVTEFGYCSFAFCTALKKVTIPDGVKMLPSTESAKEGVFMNCSSLEEVNLGKGLENIGTFSFVECTSLKKVKFPKNLKVIDTGAFYHCTSLKSVRLYKNIEFVGNISLGFMYDEATDKDVKLAGFKIYTQDNDAVISYAKDNEIAYRTGTIEIFGLNVDIVFAVFMGVVIVGLLCWLIAVMTKKRGKPAAVKKTEKKTAKAEKDTGRPDGKTEEKNDGKVNEEADEANDKEENE